MPLRLIGMKPFIFAAMYSRQEATRLKKEFWTVFGRYMAPVDSSEGEPVNWINYKTGEKKISFRMEADTLTATVALEFAHDDAGIQQLYFEHTSTFKSLLTASDGEDWSWKLHTKDVNGKTISKIYKEIRGVSVYEKDDWPRLISFFKKDIIALDEFWNRIKYSFEVLH